MFFIWHETIFAFSLFTICLMGGVVHTSSQQGL